MKTFVKWFLIVAVVAGVGFLGKAIYKKVSDRTQTKEARKAMPVAVEVQAPSVKTLHDMGFFTGSLSADSKFIIAPRVAGTLQKMLVSSGSKVANGQLIAVINNEEYVQQEKRATAELEVAKANLAEYKNQLDITVRDFERVEALRKQNISSEAQFDQAKSALNVQKSRVAVAEATLSLREAALKETQIRLAYTQIHAQWEKGSDLRFVGEKYVDEGATLAANASICTIIDISSLDGNIYVIERDYAKIVPGQPATITTDAYPNEKFTGVITKIAPQLQESSRQAKVEIKIKNEKGLLKPGMFIRAEIVFAEHKDVQAIPVAALVRREDTMGVFVAEIDAKQTGKAKFVPVERGITAGGFVEITSPVINGPVVVTGQHLLQNDSDIKIYDPNAPKEKSGAANEKGGKPGQKKEQKTSN